MLTYHQLGPVASIWRHLYNSYISHQSPKLAWKLLIENFIKISQGPMSKQQNNPWAYFMGCTVRSPTPRPCDLLIYWLRDMITSRCHKFDIVENLRPRARIKQYIEFIYPHFQSNRADMGILWYRALLFLWSQTIFKTHLNDINIYILSCCWLMFIPWRFQMITNYYDFMHRHGDK